MQEVQIGECRLILGDCRDILPTLPKVDAVITDPPYGINANKAPVRGKWGEGIVEGGNWDVERPSDETIRGIVIAGDTSIIWGGNYFADLLPPSMKWLGQTSTLLQGYTVVAGLLILTKLTRRRSLWI